MNDIYQILVIDDDSQALNLLDTILSEQGYGVTLADSGEQAIKDLTANNKDYPMPDLILLDIAMPCMDGYETYQQIREFSNVPIIFISGLEDTNHELQGLSLGAIDYITKPFITDILLMRVKNHLNSIKANDTIDESGGSTSTLVLRLDKEKTSQMKALLSDSEYQVGKLVALGYSNQEISDTLSYSYAYVKKIVNSLFEKLNVSKRQEVRPFFVE